MQILRPRTQGQSTSSVTSFVHLQLDFEIPQSKLRHTIPGICRTTVRASVEGSDPFLIEAFLRTNVHSPSSRSTDTSDKLVSRDSLSRPTKKDQKEGRLTEKT